MKVFNMFSVLVEDQTSLSLIAATKSYMILYVYTYIYEL